ncbi:TPA: hypothetical protein NG675_004632 [Vibrio parahaemolyticus]|nr:hypothetical protein [Vibrio parahaemolyticus]HCE2818487.1 hypothetical protein [Vibrio parahaemolyticus]HCG5307164.1 hypothetical protein [Vibrio parahaemolyticus]HCG7534287.1 hypothetical protein [Vibrio parahaemolyticus]HCG8238835.1 hypothetical protein [Vibrio parahaemolyticus]
MRITQSIPTDSLYKFIAIVGLILVVLFIGTLTYFNYLSYNLDKVSSHTVSYFKSQELLESIECRKGQILGNVPASKNCGNLKIDETSDFSELDQLTYLENIQKKNIAIYKKFEERANPLTENIEFVAEHNIHIFYSLGAGISFGLAILGMRRWYQLVQKPIDQMSRMDLKIRKLEKQKIESEILKIRLESKKFEQEIMRNREENRKPFYQKVSYNKAFKSDS